MNPEYYHAIVKWINENDVYLVLFVMLILSVIGLAFVVYLYVESTFGFLFTEDDE